MSAPKPIPIPVGKQGPPPVTIASFSMPNPSHYAPSLNPGVVPPEPEAEAENKLAIVQEQTKHVRQVLADNLDLLIQRGENIAILEQKSDQLDESATIFKQQSRRLRFAFCKQHAKLVGCIVLVVVLLIVFLYFAISNS